MMLTCKHCKEVLPTELFETVSTGNGKTATRRSCCVCLGLYNVLRRREHSAEIVARVKRWRIANKEHHLKSQRARLKVYRDKNRDSINKKARDETKELTDAHLRTLFKFHRKDKIEEPTAEQLAALRSDILFKRELKKNGGVRFMSIETRLPIPLKLPLFRPRKKTITVGMFSRICCGCGEMKALGEISNRKKTNGLVSYCKKCNNEKARNAAEAMSDSYIKAVLRQDGINVKDVPSELIEVKRLQLKIKRKLNEKPCRSADQTCNALL